MVDMGQADRTLYRDGTRCTVDGISWLFALRQAYVQMGYSCILDVPDGLVPQLHALAAALRGCPATSRIG